MNTIEKYQNETMNMMKQMRNSPKNKGEDGVKIGNKQSNPKPTTFDHIQKLNRASICCAD